MKYKKLFLFVVLTLIALQSEAQYRYSIKASAIYGKVLKHSKNLDSIANGSVLGGEIAFEWASSGEGQWEQYWNFPSFGIGAGFVNLGNNALLGNAVFAYPYASIPLVDNEVLRWNIKIGAGLAYLTKTWIDADTTRGVDVSTANSAISFPINFYLNGSTLLEFLTKTPLGFFAELGFSHMSNGSFRNPNFGLNFLYAKVGANYRFINDYNRKRFNPAYELPYDFEGKIVLSGFSRQVNYLDNKNFPVLSLHLGVATPLTNWYALGGGLDVFYDGIYTNRPTKDNPIFDKYLIEKNDDMNKLRVGLSINNELVMGRITGLIDFGVYLYDPIRNAYPHLQKKRGLFYGYNPDKEDGWNYFRIGLRYRVIDNFVVQVAVKTHLKTAEMLEVGIGYLLPFYRHKHGSLSSNSKYYFYHHDQREAPEYPSIWLR